MLFCSDNVKQGISLVRKRQFWCRGYGSRHGCTVHAQYSRGQSVWCRGYRYWILCSCHFACVQYKSTLVPLLVFKRLVLLVLCMCSIEKSSCNFVVFNRKVLLSLCLCSIQMSSCLSLYVCSIEESSCHLMVCSVESSPVMFSYKKSSYHFACVP